MFEKEVLTWHMLWWVCGISKQTCIVQGRAGPKSRLPHDAVFVTPDEIRKAGIAEIVGKYYQYWSKDQHANRTESNSDGGIESYETYYPIFEAMQEVVMVLNSHGEVP